MKKIAGISIRLRRFLLLCRPSPLHSTNSENIVFYSILCYRRAEVVVLIVFHEIVKTTSNRLNLTPEKRSKISAISAFLKQIWRNQLTMYWEKPIVAIAIHFCKSLCFRRRLKFRLFSDQTWVKIGAACVKFQAVYYNYLLFCFLPKYRLFSVAFKGWFLSSTVVCYP